MNGFGLALILLSLGLGYALHRQHLARERDRQEFNKEIRLAQMVAAINQAGDEVAQNVFTTRGRWN